MEQTFEDDNELSASFYEFMKTHTIEDLYTMNQEMDKKLATAKEFQLLTSTAIDEVQTELDTVKQQCETALAQIVETRKRISHAQSKLQEVEAEKAASEEAKRQNFEKEKNSGMTIEEKVLLRDKLTMQRSHIDDLEDKIEDFEKQTAENHKIFSDYRAALKEQKNSHDALVSNHEDVVERREYLISTCQSLQKTVESLREDIERLKAKLANPLKEDPHDGKSLFDEVTAEKKSLEVELVGLIEITSALRNQIRLKQDEIDELESHESENMSSVDIDYVLLKIRQLVSESGEICGVMKKIEKEVRANVGQIEKSLKTSNGEQADLGTQYTNLRDYGLDCVKVVGHECEEGSAKLKELFYEFEMLSVEYTNLQDRIAQAK